MKPGQPITVRWLDPTNFSDWLRIDEIQKEDLALVESRGFFVGTKKSKGLDCLLIAGSKQEDCYGEITLIPKCLIIR